MSLGNSIDAATVSTIKRRNPVERAIVWALIVILLALTAFEGWSRHSYQRAYNSLGDRLSFADERGPGALDATHVKAQFEGREPSRTEVFSTPERQVANGATHVEVYSWFTFNPIHPREIFVYYDGFVGGPQPRVISIQSAEEEPVSYASVLLNRLDETTMQRIFFEPNGARPHNVMPGLPMAASEGGVPSQGERQPDAKDVIPGAGATETSGQVVDEIQDQ